MIILEAEQTPQTLQVLCTRPCSHVVSICSHRKFSEKTVFISIFLLKKKLWFIPTGMEGNAQQG